MPTTTSTATSPRASSSRAPAPWVGELRDVVELGRGGMGVVWLVLDDDGHTYARKTLLPELARSQEKRELFLREAKVALELRHPNVVRTHEVGDRDGEPYLVMDFVDGMPLDRLLARSSELGERLPRRLAAYLVGCVARGLHAAHELRDESGAPQNLVHRDVSPQNVMVSREGDVVLLDFGVAKVDAAQGLTKTGEVRGKTAYMSPEQGLGDPLDRRSDLFSLGALLFECVENARMWGQGTELDVLRKLALEAPPALGGGDALSELHASLVARDPAARPPTALEVARRLDTYASPEAPPDDATYTTFRLELSRWVARVAEADLDERARALSSAIEPVRASLPGALPEAIAPDERSFAVSRAQATPRPARATAIAGLALVAALGATVVYAATRAPHEPSGAPAAPSTPAVAAADAALPVPPKLASAPAPSGDAVPAPAHVPARPSVAAAPRTLTATSAASAAAAPSASTKPASSSPPLNVDPSPF